MVARKQFSPDQLQSAVDQSENWSEFFAALGFMGRPGGNTQQRIRELLRTEGIDPSGLSGQPGPKVTWGPDELRRAIALSTTWSEVGTRLRSSYLTAIDRAKRWGLDTDSLDRASHMTAPSVPPLEDASLATIRLRDASDALAKAWYMLRGYAVFDPEATSLLDIVIQNETKRYMGVQVKTSTRKKGSNWNVNLTRHLGTSKRDMRGLYPEDEVDEFFVVTLDGGMYRFPYEALQGKQSVCLGRKYDGYRVTLF